MDAIVVEGGRPITGEVRVGGAKNSALKLMAAALLAPGVTTLRNVPDISDVALMAEVLEHLGAVVTRAGHVLTIDATTLAGHEAPYDLVVRMRASTCVLGALVGRLGRAHVAMPGGCNIGSRKVDMHIRGLEQLGVTVSTEHGYIDASGRAHGANVVARLPERGRHREPADGVRARRGRDRHRQRRPRAGDRRPRDHALEHGSRDRGRGLAGHPGHRRRGAVGGRPHGGRRPHRGGHLPDGRRDRLRVRSR